MLILGLCAGPPSTACCACPRRRISQAIVAVWWGPRVSPRPSQTQAPRCRACMYCTLVPGGGVDGQLIIPCRGSHMAVLCPSISHGGGCEGVESCRLADSLPGLRLRLPEGIDAPHLPKYLTPPSACPSCSSPINTSSVHTGNRPGSDAECPSW